MENSLQECDENDNEDLEYTPLRHVSHLSPRLSPRISEPTFGILFDIDGVIARGLHPLAEAKKMMEMLEGKDKKLSIPIAFVTNGCDLPHRKAHQISEWFQTEIDAEQVIHAQSPLSVYTMWHSKRVLFVGQGRVLEIAADLGFTDVCTIEDIKEAYPLLDVVDHQYRKKLETGDIKPGKPIPPVEAIVLIGEPVCWESYLQLLIDLLVTDGKPDHCPEKFPDVHLPILACNTDLVFMAEACMPRVAHGAFMVCLENLYEKITGHQLIYTAIIGKPSEITYRFAEHTINVRRTKMGYTHSPLRRLYFIGDNPEVDIVGSNLYNQYNNRVRKLSDSSRTLSQDEIADVRRKASVSDSRIIPQDAKFVEHVCRAVTSILVGTGVYKPDQDEAMQRNRHTYRHRDFEKVADLSTPDYYFDDCYEAIKFILEKENCDPKNIIVNKNDQCHYGNHDSVHDNLLGSIEES